MRRLPVLLLLLALAACTRPLAPGEKALAEDMFGPTIDTSRIRVTEGLGLKPLPRPKPLPPTGGKIERRPGLCDRTAPDTGPPEPPPAFAVYDRIHMMPEFYHAEIMPGWPKRLRIPEVLIFSHELVHVWQWQNRKRTGYFPARAALESLTNKDPYFYVPDNESQFLAYGFEQQAALFEDYMCYLIFDPEAPRRAEIRKILAPYFTLDRLETAMGR